MGNKLIRWNEEKNQLLKMQRGISFNQILEKIESGNIVGRKVHPNLEKYLNQQIFIIEIDSYIYYIPFIEAKDEIFLKTIIPSRKLTNQYKEIQKMKNNPIILNHEESVLLSEIENGQWEDKPVTDSELNTYKEAAEYTRLLREKKQTTIRFSVNDLAILKAKANEMGMGYQNLIQVLVHNYAKGKIELKL